MKNVFNNDCNVDNLKENTVPERNFYVEGKTDKSSFSQNQGSLKTRNKKKYLQRRLSGGTEIFQTSGAIQNDKNGNSNQVQKEALPCDDNDDDDNDDGDRVDIKRRSSLPSEAFTKTGSDLIY